MATFDFLLNGIFGCSLFDDLLQDARSDKACLSASRGIISQLCLLQYGNPRVLWYAGDQLFGNSLQQSCAQLTLVHLTNVNTYLTFRFHSSPREHISRPL